MQIGMAFRRGQLGNLLYFIAILVIAVIVVGYIFMTSGKITKTKVNLEISPEMEQLAQTRSVGVLVDTAYPRGLAFGEAIVKFYKERFKNAPGFVERVNSFEDLAAKDGAIIVGYFDDPNKYPIEDMAAIIAGEIIKDKKILWLLPTDATHSTNNAGIDETMNITVVEVDNPRVYRNTTSLKKLVSKVTYSKVGGRYAIQFNRDRADDIIRNALSEERQIVVYAAPADITNDAAIVEVWLANGNKIWFVPVEGETINDFINGENTARTRALGQLLLNFVLLLA